MDYLQHITWIFSGIGNIIIMNLFSMVLGGFIGYKIAIKQSIAQKQNAGSHSKQYQKGHLSDINVVEKEKYLDFKMKQIQKAGDNSKQTQIGGMHDDE